MDIWIVYIFCPVFLVYFDITRSVFLVNAQVGMQKTIAIHATWVHYFMPLFGIDFCIMWYCYSVSYKLNASIYHTFSSPRSHCYANLCFVSSFYSIMPLSHSNRLVCENNDKGGILSFDIILIWFTRPTVVSLLPFQFLLLWSMRFEQNVWVIVVPKK